MAQNSIEWDGTAQHSAGWSTKQRKVAHGGMGLYSVVLGRLQRRKVAHSNTKPRAAARSGTQQREVVHKGAKYKRNRRIVPFLWPFLGGLVKFTKEA
jgi:hypothetical protein